MTAAGAALLAELTENPLPGARYAWQVVTLRLPAIEAEAAARAVDEALSVMERLVDEAQAMRGSHGHRDSCDRDHRDVPMPVGMHSCATLTEAIRDAAALVAHLRGPR